MELRDILIKQRNKLNYTQQKAAELIDVSQSTYCDWESGHSLPVLANLRKISEIFSVDMNELAGIPNVNIVNSPNTISNSPNSKVETPEAIIRLADEIKNLVEMIGKLIEKK